MKTEKLEYLEEDVAALEAGRPKPYHKKNKSPVVSFYLINLLA